MTTGAATAIVYPDSDGMPLPDREFQRLELRNESDGRVWGHSDALDSDLWREDGVLRFWDAASGRWLLTQEEHEGRLESEARVAELSRLSGE